VLLDQAGHINAEAGLGAWREGQELLERLLDVRPRTPADRRPLQQQLNRDTAHG